MITTKEDFFKFADELYIRYLIDYHNTVRGLLSNEYPQGDSVEDKNLKSHLDNFAILNATTSFIMMYSHLEEGFLHLWLVKLNQKAPSGYGLDRHKGLLNELNIDIGQSVAWNELSNASKIRHCLLHANGRVSLMKNPQEIEAIIHQSPDKFIIEHDRLRVTPDYLNDFVETFCSIRDELLAASKS